MTEIRLALDVGTTAIKAAAFDSKGHHFALAQRPTRVLRELDGGSEQDMNAVWKESAACLRELTDAIEGHKIGSLGICAQGDGFWMIDAQGEPVRPATLWSDTRRAASQDLENLTASGKTAIVARGCHTSLWPGTSAIGWRWLRHTDPSQASKIAHVFTCGDWIAFKLTGAVATDFANATIPFLDLKSRQYSAASADALDCNDLLEKLPDPRSATDVLGGLSASAAKETGLPTGLPVTIATLDLGAMIVGMGLSKPGDTMMILGTTAVVNILTDEVEPTDAPIGASVLHPTHDTIIRVLAPSTGAAAFDWFASLHPKSLYGADASEISDKLNDMVVEVPIGSNGVTFLPYLNGERAPFVAPGVRAMYHGMTPATTNAEMGRAVMEGSALSLRHCFSLENGLPTSPVQLTGGGAKNPVWCQIIADVIGQDVLVNPAVDLGLWGAACIGAAATGAGDPVTLSRRQEDLLQFKANPEAHAAYSPVYERYEILSTAAREIQAELAGLQ